jgi:hypothetical protein
MTKPKEPSAVRTVSETDDVRIIEGLAYPFKGRDTYGTFFSARTDFAWDLFPDLIPGVRDGDPLFIRPVTYHHGFEPSMGLYRAGGYSPVRIDADGVWVQAQIDKRQQYYATRLGPLLDSGALGLSGESAEHAIRIDERSGEVLVWPAGPLSLTPIESNPLAQVYAARAAETGATLRIVAALADKPLDATIEEPAAPAVRGIQTFADLAAAAEMNEELPEAFDTLTSAIYSAIYALDADFNPAPAEEKRAAIQTSLDQFRDCVLGILDSASAPARSGEMFLSAIRAGKRNAAADLKSIDSIHDATVALGATAHANDSSDAGDDAARSADAQPVIRVTATPEAVRVDVEAVTQALRPVIADAVKERLAALRSG